MDKKIAIEKVQELINKYERVVSSGSFTKYNEEETKKDFILPLFEALGWNIVDKNEVSAEEFQSNGRVDYGFYLNGRVKFYLEAKSLKTDLHKEEFAKQAIRYSWNKGITWAVLTDFESIKVFNAQDISKYLSNKLFFEIPYSSYVERFEQLWLLSKEAFEQNLLNKEAEKYGKKLQKISVGATLYKDLSECRNILTHVLSQWNPQVTKDLLDEGVQRLLDRLIFLRVAEDRGIEPPTLIPLIREWETNRSKNKIPLYKSMVTKFRELDDIYNSNLFSEHPFEEWEEYSGYTEKVINILHGKKGYYEYDFKIIPSDVLGSVYENYLGYRLSQSKKGVSVDKDARKRKEQGIYYTPSFIVDYIVQNTLKPVLDRCTSINDLKKIKVLDPACGSGSFLIKALEVINKKYKEFNYPGDELTKVMILQENIYGVDLDEQAVEIARLNLLLSALEKRMKLPKLDKNIKNGNSLLSGSDKDMKRYFGNNYRERKPFNWKEEFPEVFKQGGFDVIVGNPPYVRPESVDKAERNYYINSSNFDKTFGRFDLYILFIEKALKLLKSDGIFSFIIPSSFFNQNYAQRLREWMLTSFIVKSVVDFSEIKIFGTVSVQTAIIVVENNKPNSDHKIAVQKVKSILDFEKRKDVVCLNQNLFLQIPQYMIRTDLDSKIIPLLDKVKANSYLMKDFCYTVIGAVPHDSKTGASKDRLVSKSKVKESQIPYIEGKNMNRYKINWENTYLDYQPNLMHRAKFPELFKNTKLIIRNISTKEGLLATLDKNEFFTNDTVSLCLPWYLLEFVNEKGVRGTNFQIKKSKEFNLYYILALINSRLVNFYFKKTLSSNLHVYPEAVRNLPIFKIDFINKEQNNKYKLLLYLSKQMLDLNEKLQSIVENSNQWFIVKKEVDKIDRRIDEEVYRLYDLTPEEIEIVEGKNEN